MLNLLRETLSLHKYIDFDISFEVDSSDQFMNIRRTNWSTHAKVVVDRLPTCPSSKYNNFTLESIVEFLKNVLDEAIKQCCGKSIL